MQVAQQRDRIAVELSGKPRNRSLSLGDAQLAWRQEYGVKGYGGSEKPEYERDDVKLRHLRRYKDVVAEMGRFGEAELRII